MTKESGVQFPWLLYRRGTLNHWATEAVSFSGESGGRGGGGGFVAWLEDCLYCHQYLKQNGCQAKRQNP